MFPFRGVCIPVYVTSFEQRNTHRNDGVNFEHERHSPQCLVYSRYCYRSSLFLILSPSLKKRNRKEVTSFAVILVHLMHELMN